MAGIFGISHLRKAVTHLLRLRPRGAGQALARGRADADPNEKLLFPRCFEIAPMAPTSAFHISVWKFRRLSRLSTAEILGKYPI